MSRSCPWKLKPKQAKFTILAFGEGQTEEAFLRHLGSLYILRESGVSIMYDCAGGKDPEYMIDRVIRKKKGYDVFNIVFILLDDDKLILDETQQKAREHNILIIQSKPCIEGLLLNILDEHFLVISKTSRQCKREFEDKYLNKKDKIDSRKYYKLFNKEKLDTARSKISAINELLKIFNS